MSWDTSSAAKGAARNGFQRRQHDIPDKPNQVSSAILSSQSDAPYAPPHKVHAPFSTDNMNHMDLNPDYDHRRQERRLKEDEETDQKSGLFSGLGMNKQPNGRRGQQQNNAPVGISVTASSQNHSNFNGGGVQQHPTPPHQQRSPSPSYGEQGGGGGGGGGRSHLLKKKNQEVVGKITGERTWSHTDFKVQQDSGENEHLRRQMELYNARGVGYNGNGHPGNNNNNYSPNGGGVGMQPQPPYGMNGGGGGGGRNSSPGLQPIVNNSRGGSPYPGGSNPQSENGGGSPSHLGGGGAGGQRSGSRSPYGGSDGGGGGPPYSNLGPIPSSAPGRRSPQPPLSQSSDHASPSRYGGAGDSNGQQANGDMYFTPRGDRSDARVRTPEPLPTGYVGTQRAQQALDREMQSHSNMYTSPSGGNDNGQHYQQQQYANNGMGNQHTTIVRTLQPIEPPARMLVPCVGIAPYCPNDLVSQVQSNYNEAHTSYLPTVTYSTYTYTSTN